MFVGKAIDQLKHDISLKTPARRDKHTTLLQKLPNYDRKSFIAFPTGAIFTTLYLLRNFQMGPIS